MEDLNFSLSKWVLSMFKKSFYYFHRDVSIKQLLNNNKDSFQILTHAFSCYILGQK